MDDLSTEVIAGCAYAGIVVTLLTAGQRVQDHRVVTGAAGFAGPSLTDPLSSDGHTRGRPRRNDDASWDGRVDWSSGLDY